MGPNEIVAYGEISPFYFQLLQDANLQIPEFHGMANNAEIDILRNIYGIKSPNLFKLS
jgi:hypothetical protein